MNDSRELLTFLLKTAQLSQTGIRSVLDIGMDTALRDTLRKQLRQYDSIETEAHILAGQRGWELQELDPAVRFMTDRITRARLTGKDTDTRVAEMMIQGNTRDMIRGLKTIHRYTGTDASVQILSQRLLDCETANIRQLQQFL